MTVSSPSSASRPRRPSCASPRATASPSASSVHSRKTSCGCATSRPSKSYAWRCSISPPGTIPTGWSPAMATGRLLRSGPTNNRPWIRPHEMNDAAACLTTVVQYRKQRREQSALQPEIAVEPFRTVAQAIKVASLYDLLVFDGPPHSMAGTLEIARASDIVVLPSGLSLDDLKPTVLLAHELVEAGVVSDKIAVGLCRVGY